MENHLLDWQVASIIISGAALSESESTGRERQFRLAALALAAVLAIRPTWDSLRHRDRVPRRQGFEEALRLIGNTRQPILAENPIMPILAGERPYMVDAFMFRVLKGRDPSYAQPLLAKLRDRSFGAVILGFDPHSESGRQWYAENSFDMGFVEELEKDYQLAGQWPGSVVYLPRK
jgi:hypothetical protein